MNREQLVQKRKPRWDRLQELLREAEKARGPSRLGPTGISELAECYRGLASDLMRVRRDKLGADLERHLDNLAARAHNTLYAGTARATRESGNAKRSSILGSDFWSMMRGIIPEFPGALRRNGRFFLLACILFFGTGAVAGTAAYVDEGYALSILSDADLNAMEAMHGKKHEGRDFNTDAAMHGFYVLNNVGIAFRCFATGILFGLGPIFYLIFNGLHIGVVVGHLTRTGYGENIFGFGASHGPWELTAIAIAGAAGLQMGYAMVSTHGRTRLGNLQAHGLELLRQIAGAASFLMLAAALEGWYSPSSLPVHVKYWTGIGGWVLLILLLVFWGRGRPLPVDVVRLRARTQVARSESSSPGQVSETRVRSIS